MTKTCISTTSAPAAIGPYSQGISTGSLVFCSGQIALDPSSGELLSSSIAEETSLCINNLKAILEEAGSGLDRILKTTIYVTDMNDFAEVNEAYGSFFPSEPPARATVGVAALPKGARVEVECVAAV
ncbi:MAG TPA: RidA family protein [Actinomycetota bacterium]|nr:RidA family protein [Actinomycetota bacterium]